MWRTFLKTCSRTAGSLKSPKLLVRMNTCVMILMKGTQGENMPFQSLYWAQNRIEFSFWPDLFPYVWFVQCGVDCPDNTEVDRQQCSSSLLLLTGPPSPRTGQSVHTETQTHKAHFSLHTAHLSCQIASERHSGQVIEVIVSKWPQCNGHKLSALRGGAKSRFHRWKSKKKKKQRLESPDPGRRKVNISFQRLTYFL